MSELGARLRALRAELIGAMASELAADDDWHAWLPLLAQVETAVQAVEAVVEEESRG